MDYLEDDLLIALIKKGDTHAEALLCSKYWVFANNLGRKFASLYSDLGLTADEFTAVCFSALVTALKKYVPKEGKAFRKYWQVIAKNDCINYVHENSFIDFTSLRPVSLDSYAYGEGLTLHETCGSIDHMIKYNVLKKQLHEYIESEKSPLNENEKLVAYYVFLNGYTAEEVRLLTNWPLSRVYKAIDRARKKVSHFLKVVL